MLSGLLASVAAISMLAFSGSILIGCLIYSFYDRLPFLQNPYFGDILGAGLSAIFCSFIVVILEHEYWFRSMSGNFGGLMDSLTVLWLPLVFVLWIVAAWVWNTVHQKPFRSVLGKIFRSLISFISIGLS